MLWMIIDDEPPTTVSINAPVELVQKSDNPWKSFEFREEVGVIFDINDAGIGDFVGKLTFLYFA